MAAESFPDYTEQNINSYAAAIEVLQQLPANHPGLKHWSIWFETHFSDVPWYDEIKQDVTIAYARMAMRNGTLSDHTRCYHNEYHINDLLLRIIYCAEHSKQLSQEGLALLCVFAACHDLRQNETRKSASDDSLVGANEQASFQEAARIIKLTGTSSLWTAHHLLVLKTMIEGSTFGSGGKRSKNFFQGNLAKHLLTQIDLPPDDEQLVLLACDLDTANVSLPIAQFAESAIHIYEELLAHENTRLSAHQFFCEQQKTYFFDQQCFHSDITKQLFQPHKKLNEEKLMDLTAHINQLSDDLSAENIKLAFRTKAQQLSDQ